VGGFGKRYREGTRLKKKRVKTKKNTKRMSGQEQRTETTVGPIRSNITQSGGLRDSVRGKPSSRYRNGKGGEEAVHHE